MKQVKDNAPKGKAPDAEELQLLDAYSLAANFFLFSLIIFLTLTKPGDVASRPVSILLVVLATCSAAMFLAFSVLMFKPKSMGHFRRLLSYPHESSGRRLLTFGFVFFLWVSLPITFLAGIVDASSRIPEHWQTPARLAGFLWLLVVPLAAMMVLLFKHNWRFKLKVPSLITAMAFCAQAWRNFAAAVWREGPFQFLFIAIAIATVQLSMFLLPKLHWLPATNEADSLLKVLWQVHASILGVTVVVVTIIITVIANEKDRTRTWKLYAEKTRFVPVIWFNLIAIVSEGIASLQTSGVIIPMLSSDKAGNLILSEGILLVSSILMAAMLFTVTMRFLDDDYIEDLAEKRIISAMPNAVGADIEQHQRFIARLKGDADGH